jgi:hypothetical protein
MYKEHKAKNGSHTILLSASNTKKDVYELNITRYDYDGYMQPGGSHNILETNNYFEALDMFEKIATNSYMAIIY